MRLANLGESARGLLDALCAAFPGELPAERYVGAGEIPWDGEGVYLYLGGSLTGQAGQPISTNLPSPDAMVQYLTMYVMVVRSVSSFGYWASDPAEPAPPEQLDVEGQRAFDDAGGLIAAALQVRKDPTFATTRQSSFVIGACTPLGPQGGLAAVRLELVVSVD